ncbi:MAG: hypothetical protein AB7V27_09585 [Candidatus Binatia bacterium]
MKEDEMMLSKKGLVVAIALAAGLAGCTAKVDPADMQRIDAAVSRAEAAANKAAAAAQSASQAAAQADAAAAKCAAVGEKTYRK